MNLNDRDLLLRVSMDDEESFRCLFARHRDKLFAYILKVTKSREVSEEIVMDVFLKIWQIRTGLARIEDFSSFIFHIARNKALDFLRMAAKDHVLRDLLWEEIEAVSDTRSDGKLLLDELESQIEIVVDGLSPQRQSVFRLHREENLTYDQIAVHLQLSKSTVKNHMLDSLRFIRLHLTANLDLIILCFILFKK